MKKITSLLLTTPFIMASCGSNSSGKLSENVIKASQEEFALSEASVTAKSLPVTKENGSKKVLKFGLKGNNYSEWNNGEWKTPPNDSNGNPTAIRGATEKALFDIIDTFNRQSTTTEIEIVEQSIKDVHTNLSTSGSTNIPHIYFGDMFDLKSLSKYENIKHTINNKDNILNIAGENVDQSFDEITLNSNSLVGVVDSKLMNGMICGFNEKHGKKDVKVKTDKESKLCSVLLTDKANNFTSVNNKSLYEFSKTLPVSIIGSHEELSYEVLAQDMNVYFNIMDNWKNTPVKHFFGSSFVGETIRSLAGVSNERTPNEWTSKEKDSIDNISNKLLSHKENGFRAKEADVYNTAFVETGDIVFDVTKGFALNYFQDSKYDHLIYTELPGFNYHDNKGLKVLSDPATTSASVNEFISYLYGDDFGQGSWPALQLGTLSYNHSPLTYYSIFSKTKPITNKAIEQIEDLTSPDIDVSTNFRNYYKVNDKHIQLFEYFKKATTGYSNDFKYQYGHIDEIINREFLKKYV